MAAGPQVWLVLALFSVLEVDQCRALADPQVAYNRNGIPFIDGRWSWQTPEGSSVWIQYPVNNQGHVPWTPAGFSYSISSDSPSNRISFDERIHSNFLDVNHGRIPSHTFRSGRELELQIPNNNYESSFFLVNNQNNNQNEIKTEEETIQNPLRPLFETSSGPATNQFQVSLMDKFPRPQITNSPVQGIKTFPEPVMDKFPRPQIGKSPVPEINIFPGQVIDQFSGSVIDRFPDPVIDTFPSLLQVPTESPIEFKTVKFNTVATPTVLPIEADFRNNVNNNFDAFNGIDRNDQVKSSTEFNAVPLRAVLPAAADFGNNVNNNPDSFNILDRNDQVEGSAELGPVIRLSSRGRPIRRKLTTRKPSIARKRVNRPEPRLLQAASNRQGNVGQENVRQGNVRLTSRGRPQLVR